MEKLSGLSLNAGGENSFSRKQFLKVCGLSAGAAVGLSNCTEVPNAVELDGFPPLQITPDPRPGDYRIWIGSGDVGLMNTIHIYTRLEATFYTKVLENSYEGMTPKEEAILTALKNHEIAHSDFLGALLGDNAVGNYRYNLDFINYSSRSAVLQRAADIENLGVAMYNNFPELIKRPKLYDALIKLASVEARHAVSLNFLQAPALKYIGRNGLDTFASPQAAWNIFYIYFIEGFDISGLPRVEFDR